VCKSRACHERPAQPARCQRPSSALSPVLESSGPGCRRQGLFAVQVEVPLDRALLVFLAHAPVSPQQEPGLGIRSAFDPVCCRGDVQPGVFAFEVGESVPAWPRRSRSR
jgi:hypothetical protein